MLLADAVEARVSIGTPLYPDLSTMVSYYRHTVLPFVFCCKEGITTSQSPSQCSDFQSLLPTSNGAVNVQSTMPANNGNNQGGRTKRVFISPYVARNLFFSFSANALAFGDPHIITLDGHQYTFNGKGEYTYLETVDGFFVSQTRMEQAIGTNGTITQATVITAIVAKTNTSDVVQMEVVNGNEMEVRVNRVAVDFSVAVRQQYFDVAVTQQVNGTVTVTFVGNYFMEVGAENGILSLMKFSLPESARGRTQGLMGNYNGNDSDDFIPRDASEPLPVSSTLEEIHNQFGVSCEFNLVEPILYIHTHYCI